MTDIITQETDAGVRLDLFLAAHLRGSRTRIQTLIKAGAVQINGTAAKPHTFLRPGDKISILELSGSKNENTPLEEQKHLSPPPLTIVFEDEDVLVIEKPAGIAVHATDAHRHNITLADALLEHVPGIQHVGENPLRPGIVHRLDKAVSGLMTVAKTQPMFQHLKRQFQERTVKKEYLGLVYGRLLHETDEIRFKISRSKSKGHMVARPESQEGKEALTIYEVIERFKTTTYVHVRLHTGRTHQIRVHFFALGHPLVGDKLYRLKKMKVRPIPMERLFLHSHTLGFEHLNGEAMEFTSPLPGELEAVLNSLRS